MKSKAAILGGVGRKWEVADITLDPPRTGEVLVRTKAAGICHSDDHFSTGDTVPSEDIVDQMRAAGLTVPDTFPFIGGHEGAGVVVAVGPGVTTLSPGDHVATSFIPACGRCRWCVNGMSYICDSGANTFSKYMIGDGTARRHYAGEDLLPMMQLGTFSDHFVAAEQSLIKIDNDVPFHVAALVSCGVTTGWGSATTSAGTQPGDTVVVIGVGGVGINAVQGARASGARRIVAVDPISFKRQSALDFGATHTVSSVFEALPLVQELTHGVMAERVVVTAGVVHVDLIQPAIDLTSKGGTCVLTGVTPIAETTVPLGLSNFVNYSKTLKGTLYGAMNPRASTPMLLGMYRDGLIKIDELVTTTYSLDDINQAFDDMRAGSNIRGVITFE